MIITNGEVLDKFPAQSYFGTSTGFSDALAINANGVNVDNNDVAFVTFGDFETVPPFEYQQVQVTGNI